MKIASKVELMDLSTTSTRDLFVLLSSTMRELKDRGLVRTANNPVADLAELLFCDAMRWRRGHQQSKDIDAVMEDGGLVQIKARRVTRGKHSRSGIIRDRKGWDWVALAIFNEDFSLQRAVLVPRAITLRHLKWSDRQKGWYISLSSRGFWSETGLIDVTPRLTASAEVMFASGRLS
jgi:hypothetical protein